MVINTNANAVDAANALRRSTESLSRSLARLSSGSKIINPSDDAAGLAVSEKIDAQDSRLQAAKINTQNTMSLTQTADGFLQTMSTVLNRMNELTVLANDVTKNPADIALYGTEFNQLKDQLRDIVGNGPNGTDSLPNWDTSGAEPVGQFNGISLFGARSSMVVVVGPSGDQTINVGQINLREIGGAVSDLLWDNSVDGAQADVSIDSVGALNLLNEALQQVSGERAGLGSTQSRLEVIDAQLQIQRENMDAANSRIRDVNVAEESTSYAKYNILVQAGTSMLSQANSLPENVLRLLN